MNFDSERFTTCGILESSAGGYSEIVCDNTTGDCIFVDDMIGPTIFDNITVTAPVAMELEVLYKIVAKLQCDGVIVIKDFYIVLRDGKAEYMSLLEGCKITNVVEYDLSTEFEDDVD